jgi:predicted nucleic acid-binding protein
MTLSDASVLVALINAGDRNHSRCVAASPGLSSPLITTWPCFTEAMHLLGRYGGFPAQEELWHYVEVGLLTFHAAGDDDAARMHELMRQYRDTPMDLADASLVVAAESLGLRRIFTFDSDFYVYRALGIEPFEVIP